MDIGLPGQVAIILSLEIDKVNNYYERQYLVINYKHIILCISLAPQLNNNIMFIIPAGNGTPQHLG